MSSPTTQSGKNTPLNKRMTRKDNSFRRSSQEERRVFRTARLEYVELGRITGADPAAEEFFQASDLASARLLRFDDWSEVGIETLLLCRPPVLVGNADGKADLGWLANAEVLLAAQQQWPASKRIPAVVLAHQVSQRTRRQAAAGGLFACCTPSLSESMAAIALFRAWQTAIELDLNPLATALKMNLVRACNCDPRKLPPARLRQTTEGHAR